MELFDISPPIDADLAVWPGDTSLSRELLCDMKKGDNITLSTLHATVHLGSHADAPNHYLTDGTDIAERSLNFYVGPCNVVEVPTPNGQRVSWEAFQQAANLEELSGRVLIKTGSYPNPNEFNEDFCGLEPELVDELHNRDVCLIGIDTPSVDLFASKALEAHSRFAEHDMAILEGIVLSEVPAGLYELIALPLKLRNFDASPVRAILRSL